MRCISLILLVAVVVFPAGCRAKQKEITSLQRKEAATLASEAQFAVTIRDFARAESLLAKATELCPDSGTYWVNLGSVRMKLANRDAAKKAYNNALSAFEEQGKSDKEGSGPWLQQIYVLALLGRADDARALQEKVAKRFPADPDVQQFVSRKQLERTLADPKFKEAAL
jgi:tetratricopeptide (TPR) repeat protein